MIEIKTVLLKFWIFSMANNINDQNILILWLYATNSCLQGWTGFKRPGPAREKKKKAALSSRLSFSLCILIIINITGPGGPPGIFPVSRRPSPPLLVYMDARIIKSRMLGSSDGVTNQGYYN